MALNDAENFLGNDQTLLFVAKTKTVVYRQKSLLFIGKFLIS
jgi:hypothetical protein